MHDFIFRVKGNTILGGALAMTPAVFKKINGFSNKFWGWGREDVDIFAR